MIETHKEGKFSWEAEIETLRQQLAASQAREVQLREALEYHRDVHCTNIQAYKLRDEALASLVDTSALEAMIAKAGEVMRERCLNRPHPPYAGYLADGFIRALPIVTLEDLQK